MNYRKLRIAWSVGCGLLTVLVIALWVRSYWWEDGVCWGVTDKSGFFFFSAEGRLDVEFVHMTNADISRWFVDSYPAGDNDFFWFPREAVEKAMLGFSLRIKDAFFVVIPHWFAVLINIGVIAVLRSERSWRFSLRTLLIAITLIGLVLGAVVAMSK